MSISKAEHDELCCVYAGLLLFDDKIDITADKINKIIEASGNKVEAYYPEFFAKYLASSDINALLNASASSAAPAEAAEDKKDDKKDDKKGLPLREHPYSGEAGKKKMKLLKLFEK